MSELENKLPTQAKPTNQHQLALELFNSMKVPTTVDKMPGALNYLKPRIFLDTSALSLIAKRALNAMHFIAQGDPSFSEPDDGMPKMYSEDAGYFKWLIRYNSNTPHLRAMLKETRHASISSSALVSTPTENKGDFIDTPLIMSTGLRKGRVFFELHGVVKKVLKAPDDFGLVSMRIQALFTSLHALTLYEILVNYRDSETPWIPLKEFISDMHLDQTKYVEQFKYLRRDVIDVAIEQINKHSDIHVEFDTKKSKRYVTHLKFTVTPSARLPVDSMEGEAKLYRCLTEEFGLSQTEMEELTAKPEVYTSERIKEAIEFAKHRMKSSAKKYPGKYLMKVLREGLRIGSIEREALEKETKAQLQLEAIKAAPAAAFEAPVELPVGDALVEAWDAFSHHPSGKLIKNLAPTYEEASEKERRLFKEFIRAKATPVAA